jgi:miniconductance mechanosensitive channel
MTSFERWAAVGWIWTAAGLALLALTTLLCAWLARRAFERGLRALTSRTGWTWDDLLVQTGAARRLARMVPSLLVQAGIGWVPGLAPTLVSVTRNVALALTTLFGMLAVGAALDAFEAYHRSRSRSRAGRAIKSYVQFVKLVLYVVGLILIVSLLIDRSPLILLSGVGALSAVLMLVFKDTLLGLVAGAQLTSHDMLRVGDWIEMPREQIDGDVVDVALHTVKVRNWDNTISTIPSWKLISEPFKNWRGMSESGGRRIKRALRIDASSVHFLDEDEVRTLSRFSLLRGHLTRKHDEISAWNRALGADGTAPVNTRRLTNLGSFRAYALAYLQAHPGLRKDMTLLVRQLDPTSEGVPLEIYSFTATTAWGEYEAIQSDLFDHLIAILPEFGLRLYQRPGGEEIVSALRGLGGRAASGARPLASANG